ncbi:Altered inheritance of mitochondria protein 6 [Arachnomyces sp. PD_36]|nr:Altered inheritance of mitochondria protein 6 [Arachnomyces sp. PD_36]
MATFSSSSDIESETGSSSGLNLVHSACAFNDWTEPGLDGSNASAWREDFSRDIIPVSCHSHNDYWRRVPLYDSLAAGCTGVEADVWLKDHELYVAHDIDSIRPHRTFKSLYIDPITSILTHQNTPNKLTNGTGYRGAFDTSPNTTLSLLIDLKEDGTSAWPVVQEQLQPLRENGWLTHFNGASVVQRPVTVVVTGDASFDLVKQNTTYRDIFFDAPLDKLNDDYNSHNSYYASMSFKDIGQIWFNRLSSKQVAIIREHIKMASSRGLKSRYWDIPSWPVSLRMNIWRILQENDIGMLNVDDLITASRWNWEWCTVLGLTLC